MTANVGRDVLVEFAIAAEDAALGSLTFLTLGMMRGKDLSVKWDDVDTTADKSPSFTKSSLVTFKSVEFKGDGVAYTDAIHNQKTLKQHVISPPSTTGYQPKAWFRVTYPDGSFFLGPFIVTQWDDSNPYANECTWSINSKSNGAVTFTP